MRTTASTCFAQVIHCPHYLWLEYNEQGFSFQDEALCSLRASTKSLNKTGDKGIGFKAAFVLSARPHVHGTVGSILIRIKRSERLS